jgi:23S rRNA (cytidine2498-2'-O)-methyltransferase
LRFLATRPPPVDWIVSDMRVDARDAARLLVTYEGLLTAKGRVLTTLKLPTRGYLHVLDAALALLEPRYRLLAGRQLFHNRSEVTLLLGLRRAVDDARTAER